MTFDLPQNILIKDSSLNVYYEDKLVSNHTKSEIVIIGSRNGFLSLANSLIYLINDLELSIPIHKLPFVSSSIMLTIACDDKYLEQHGDLKKIGEREFIWGLSEDNASLIATHIHSLGHLNPELHLDDEKKFEDISVYCVVDSD